MNTIGCNICRLRKQNNMSQEQVAELMNVSRQSVSKWERDETLPDIYNLEALSRIFSVSIDSLVKSDESSSSTSTPSSAIILTKAQLEDREMLISKANILMIVAIVIYIITVFGIAFLSDMISLSGSTMGLIFGIGAALGTGLIIYSGTIRTKSKRLYGGADTGGEDDENEKLQNSIDGGTGVYVLRTLAVIVFLYLGFFKGLWHPGWMVFILSELLVRLYYGIFAMVQRKNGETHSDNISDS